MPICTSGPNATAQSTAYAATVAATGTQSGAHYCAQHRHQPSPSNIPASASAPPPSNSPASPQYYSPPLSSTSALKPAPISVFL